MAFPTVAYSTTTATLPNPTQATESGGMSMVVDVTLGGNSRVQKLHRKKIWTLGFVRANYTVWSAINTIWNEALDANSFPTFTFTDVFSSASGVEVVIELSEFTPYQPDPTKGDFTMTLTQSGTY